MKEYKNTLYSMKHIVSLIYNKDIIHKMNDTFIRDTLSLLRYNRYPNKTTTLNIIEHLPTIYKYATECASIFETGIDEGVSTWTLLNGLNDSIMKPAETPHILLNDIHPCDIHDQLTAAKDVGIDIHYVWQNNLDMDITRTYDMVYIDTWHVYGQLKRELEKFSNIANKYIIMHNTTVDADDGETVRRHWDASVQSANTGIPVEEIKKGLWPAIEEFIANHGEWYIKERFHNNHGLTILARKSSYL